MTVTEGASRLVSQTKMAFGDFLKRPNLCLTKIFCPLAAEINLYTGKRHQYMFYFLL